MDTTRSLLSLGWLCLIAGLTACTSTSPVTNLFRTGSPHEQYSQSLRETKLDHTALGNDWLNAGERALYDSLRISVPYRETGYFSASKATAVGYRVNAQRGDRYTVSVQTQGQKSIQVFLDVFSVDEKNRVSLLVSAKPDSSVLTWEPRKKQTYLIRVQPELLRNGSYTFSITRQPALAFPVKGRDSRQISSFFGADRDGGRRRHEGVDIFAPKGTPALASINGTISRVGTSTLGGNVAFLTDNERNIRLYYAHLDRWNVVDGQRVSIGDTVGFVGNTGNARTTGPHLHFGIYGFSDGAQDPLPFIRAGSGPATQPLLPTKKLGDSVRVSVLRTAVRVGAGNETAQLREVPRHTPLTIVGGTEAWPRVELPDGLTGYVPGKTTEPDDKSLRRLAITSAVDLRDAASLQSGILRTLPVGSTVELLAAVGSFQLVRTTTGQTGWLVLPTTISQSANASVR